jgi:hypothetical protein
MTVAGKTMLGIGAELLAVAGVGIDRTATAAESCRGWHRVAGQRSMVPR